MTARPVGRGLRGAGNGFPGPARARALGDPTRHRIFREIAEARRPLTVADLTGRLGLHHNAVRQHLAKLRDAGLVVEGNEVRDRPGRPRLLYRPSPEVAAAGGSYERLALLLLEVVRSGETPREIGWAAGARAATDGRGSRDPVRRLEEETARQGFRPRPEPFPGGEDLVLDGCPYATAAVADPATVCELHRGFAEGFIATLGGIVADDLVARDPRRAGCRIRLHRVASRA